MALVTFSNETGGTLYATLRGPASYDLAFEFIDLPELIESPPEPTTVVPGIYEYTISTEGHSLTGVTTLVAPGAVAHGVTVREYWVSCLIQLHVPELGEVMEVLQCRTSIDGDESDVSMPGLP